MRRHGRMSVKNWEESFRHANGEVVLEVMHACGINVLF